jgi:hypothetical protein
MALIAGLFIITVILALFGALAQRWGVDTREGFIDPSLSRTWMR